MIIYNGSSRDLQFISGTVLLLQIYRERKPELSTPGPRLVNMKEAIVSPKDGTVSVEIKDSPIPEPGPNEILIKVVVSGSNPKDW